MTVDYQHWSAEVRRLAQAVAGLAPLAARLGVPRPEGDEWHELLIRKLLPDAQAAPILIVAVVGGTNIGKSLLFNHLAGENASAVSRLAAGTKHPVCLAPAAWADEKKLAERFEGFELSAWSAPEDPLRESAEHKLFWREGKNVPPRLLLLDTPDIDSDALVNWQRADHVRQAADVLIAVLTQQKYNDAAVKQFFRKAADADKPVIVVFNQCDWEADADYLPLWLKTFADETGARPELVYAVPYDRRGAETLQLSFQRLSVEGKPLAEPGASLREELAALRFDAIKIRTFRGALETVLDPQRGAPAYLDRVRRASDRFIEAAAGLAHEEVARLDWPNLPPQLLVEEIGQWWEPRRPRWVQGIHGFYRGVAGVVTAPIRTGWRIVMGPSEDPLTAFRTRERETIIRAVERFLDDLERLGAVGNEILKPRVEKLLGGRARASLLERVQRSYDELPALGQDYREFVAQELNTWADENPSAVTILRSLDGASAVGRPAITVALVLSGVAWTGADHALVQAASGALAELVKDTLITTTVTGGGEAVVAVAGESAKQAAARLFARLQSGYAQLRAGWLAELLELELLGELLAELRLGAEITQSDEFRAMSSATKSLSAVTLPLER
jgi:hypothetical protein